MPTLGLKIFLALIPIVLTLSAVMVAGLPSESAVDFDVGRKFFLFQFVVVFLFITIIQAMSSGSGNESGGDSNSNFPFVALFNQLVDDPQQIPTWLGTSIPQVVRTLIPYFLQYLEPSSVSASRYFLDARIRMKCESVCRCRHTCSTSW